MVDVTLSENLVAPQNSLRLRRSYEIDRAFGGLTLAQCAEVLGVSARTADTWWAYARAWLAVEAKKP